MNGIKARVILLCTSLILLTAFTMQLSHGWFIHQHNQRQIYEQVANASHFLHQYIDSRETSLRYSTEIIIQDFGFREALATNDLPTISSMLTNHAQRIQADLMLLVDNEGKLVAANELNFPLTELVNLNWSALQKVSGQGQFAEINNRLYRLFSLPVKAPHQIAMAFIAFEVTIPLLETLKVKTGLDIIFQSSQSELFLTTLTIDKTEFEEYLLKDTSPNLWWKRSQYLLEQSFLQSPLDQQIELFLLADLSVFYRVLDRLNYSLLALTFCIVLLAVILSTLLARRLANPLSSLYQDLTYRATHDHLTKLLNRHAAIERISEELIRSSRSDKIYCVALCDIDNFKKINDTYGHAVGDEVLRRFASRLKTTLRHYDVLGRFGGEEFLIALQLKPDEATASFERLRTIIDSAPIVGGSHLIPVTMSCGVCLLWPEEAVPPIDVILQAADTALYKAKDHGRNQVIFTHVPQFPMVEAAIEDEV